VKPKIVVQGQPRRFKSLPVLLAAMGIAVAAPVLYGLAHNASLGALFGTRSHDVQAQSEREQSAAQLRELKTQNEQLKQEVADLSRGREIDRAACGSVQKSLSTEQQEAASLREQLAFYRGVVSPEALRSGLRVNDLKVLPGSSPGAWRYELILVQSARQERRASGRAEMRFIGRDNAAQRSITLAELVPEAERRLLFSFRHFQEFDGEFRLPAGFAPQRAVVTLLPDGGDAQRIEEEFDWNKIQEKPG
jgi:hypothetical protein